MKFVTEVKFYDTLNEKVRSGAKIFEITEDYFNLDVSLRGADGEIELLRYWHDSASFHDDPEPSGEDQPFEKHPIRVCISCGEAILPSEPMVDSRHGAYHGAPKTCVDGRKEEN